VTVDLGIWDKLTRIVIFLLFVAGLLAVAPPRILFDGPDSLVFRDFSTEYHRRFYERLRGRLRSAYRPAGTEHGWLVLTPIARAAR